MHPWLRSRSLPCVVASLLCLFLPFFTQASEIPPDQSVVQIAQPKDLKFGLSIGLGTQSITGNRGTLWKQDSPIYEIQLYYWLIPQLAFNIEAYTVKNYYKTAAPDIGRVNVDMIHVGLGTKYYFDLNSITSSLSFISPYVLFNIGTYNKTENSLTEQTQDADSSLGYSLGAGLRLALRQSVAYFELEGRYHAINSFKDTKTTRFESLGLNNLSGQFLSITGSILLIF